MKNSILKIIGTTILLIVLLASCKKEELITPPDDKPQATREWVEISGTKWATRNVGFPGTFVENPEDIGMYYQWNRIIGWCGMYPMTSSDGTTDWDDSIDESNTWERTNDPCPPGWRIPTTDEAIALVNSDSQYTTINEVGGRIVGIGENTIFIPVDTFMFISGLSKYWCSNTLFIDNDYRHCYIGLYVTFIETFAAGKTAAALSVRCVLDTEAP